jgi:hypothetical protein
MAIFSLGILSWTIESKMNIIKLQYLIFQKIWRYRKQQFIWKRTDPLPNVQEEYLQFCKIMSCNFKRMKLNC